jgi:hypothetical protein
MNAQISPKEWQTLSEYLDGQLSPHDRSKLEQRMHTRPELRDGLEELRRLRSVLRTVPRRKVPHNFTLTRAMVEKPAASRWTSWVPALSLSSAMATFLLIVSMLVRLPGGAPTAMVSPEMESSRVMMVEPESVESMQDAADAPPIIVWGGPENYADGRGGMGGGAAGMAEPGFGSMMAPEGEMFVDEGMPAPEEQAVEELPVEPPAPGAMEAPVVEPEMLVEEVPSLSAEAEVQAEDLAEPLVGTGPILGVAPVEEQGAMQLKSAPVDTELLAEEQQAAAEPVSPWLFLQVTLVLIAIATGISALYLKRKSKA